MAASRQRGFTPETERKKERHLKLSLGSSLHFAFWFAFLLLLQLTWSQIHTCFQHYWIPWLWIPSFDNWLFYQGSCSPWCGAFLFSLFLREDSPFFPKGNPALVLINRLFPLRQENYHSNNIYLKILPSRSHKNYIHFSELKRTTCTDGYTGRATKSTPVWRQLREVLSSWKVTWIRRQKLADPRL